METHDSDASPEARCQMRWSQKNKVSGTTHLLLGIKDSETYCIRRVRLSRDRTGRGGPPLRQGGLGDWGTPHFRVPPDAFGGGGTPPPLS